MSDMNFTHCIVVGRQNDIKKIYNLFKKYEDSPNLIYGFVPLVNLVEELDSRINKQKFLTTYKIHKLSEDGQRLDFYLQGRRGHPYFELKFLEKFFSRHNIKLYYFSNSECFNYKTNDKKGLYFKTKFVVDYLDEVYLNTWNEVLDTVSQLVNQKITSKEQLEDILEEINTPDSEHIVVTEVQIV